MISALLPACVAVAGAVVYGISVNPKAQQLGLVGYGCGLLAVCFNFAGKVVELIK